MQADDVVAAERPATISSSCTDPGVTSTIDVHQARVRHRPSRASRVSSNPNASTWPMRSTSASSTAAP
jgi:hypothetical protein